MGHLGLLRAGSARRRLRAASPAAPIVATRRMLLVAKGSDLIDAGFPVLPTLDHPHWTVVLPAPSIEQFAAARRCFDGPVPNPVWTGGR